MNILCCEYVIAQQIMKEIGICFSVRIPPRRRKSRGVEHVLPIMFELYELTIYNFELYVK